LFLLTPAPEFLPISKSWDDLGPADRDGHWIAIQWNPQWFLNLLNSPSAGEISVDEGSEFGLRKRKTLSYGRDSKEYVGYRYSVFSDEQTKGVNATDIRCGAASRAVPKSCQHRFLNNGRHFYFRHRPDDLPVWQDMQRRLLELFTSFEVKGTPAQ
jgi:hypothetical protein